MKPTSRRSTAALMLLAGSVSSLTCAGTDERNGVDAHPGPCNGRILEQDVTNARDLGEQPLSDGSTTTCGRLFRGGDLTGLGDGGCTEFESLGIATVVDLRQQHVQSNEPSPVCVSENVSLVSAAMPKLLPDTPENYLALLEETEAIRTLFGALGAAASYPVYFHCVIGRDRASVAAAMILLALEADRNVVVDEFELSVDAGVAVKSECIGAVLDELEARGGIESFLASAGVEQSAIETLRAVMLVN